MATDKSTQKHQKLIWFTAALSLVGIVAFLSIILLLSNRKEVRYSRQYSDLYEAIYMHTGTVDVAVGGSSRVRRGVFAPYLMKFLVPFFEGREPVIYNLGLAGNGMDGQIRVLLDLLEHRKVNYIFLQIGQLRTGRKKHPTHRNLKKIGTLRDILVEPIKSYPLDKSLTHRAQMIYDRISEALDICLSNPMECTQKDILTPARTIDTSTPRFVDVERQRKFLKRRENDMRGDYFKYEPRQWSFEKGKDQRTGHYLDKLIDLAKEKGTTVVFMDFPKFEWNVLKSEFVEYVQKRFGVEYLYFNSEKLLKLGEHGFGNYGHVNIRGEQATRKMIVDYFRSVKEGSKKKNDTD